ncbi:hypothetical protein GCM10010342_49490 [Streptomyces anulatus]|nr:hypothetical protein GCM10010342_49490 [Streptomyces anulatus]
MVSTVRPSASKAFAVVGDAVSGPPVFPDAGAVMPAVRATEAAATRAYALVDLFRKIAPAQEWFGRAKARPHGARSDTRSAPDS